MFSTLVNINLINILISLYFLQICVVARKTRLKNGRGMKLTKPKFLVLLILAGFIVLFSYVYLLPKYTTNDQIDDNEKQIDDNKKQDKRDEYEIYIPPILPNKKNITINILWWIFEHWEEPIPPKYIDDSCLPPEVQCFYETNKSTFQSSDFVVFFPRFPEPIEPDGVATLLRTLSLSRPLSQSWILHSLESPFNDVSPSNPHFMKYFNYSSNYQLSSDIPDTYFYQYMQQRNTNLDFIFLKSEVAAENKNKEAPIAWYASNCGSGNGRENYVNEMQKYIKIDSYGSCLKNKAEQPGEEIWQVLRRYKFYLVFENTCCEDYVTEKFWRTLHFGLVPVVYGAPNFKKFIPAPKSVINVEDFASPKELSEYLNYLDKNDTAYNEYLSYKTDHQLYPDFTKMMNSSPCKSVYGNICKFAAEITWGHKQANRTGGLRVDQSCSKNVYYVPH